VEVSKTNRPLQILVHPDLLETPVIQDLIAKQNLVELWPPFVSPEMTDYDLVLGPNCWRIVPGLETALVGLAVKAARRIKYGKEETDNGNVPS
jgi:hypothetical protein